MVPRRRYFADDSDFDDELTRLRVIEDEWDPVTRMCVEGLGLQPGWRCLEVGAGGGSIVRWLSERTGPTGCVVAADIDPRFLGDLNLANVEVRTTDITSDDLEPDAYDLVHCRLLLMHMDDPEMVIGRMVAALRPGGWLLIEEPDNEVVAASDGLHRLADGFNQVVRTRVKYTGEAGIMDMVLGKSIPAMMQRVGLDEVDNYCMTRIVAGGDPVSQMWLSTWARVDNLMLAAGALSANDIDTAREAYVDPTFSYRDALVVSTWGRRPK